MKHLPSLMVVSFLCISSVLSQDMSRWNEMIGSAYTGNASFSILQRLCDEVGGRLVGSPQDEKGLNMLAGELQKFGCDARIERFTIPGWVRGEDEVMMTSPVPRRLKTAVLGYVSALPAFEAPAVFVPTGYDEDYRKIDVKGKTVVTALNAPQGKPALLRYEAIDIAARNGASGILLMNDKPGTLTVSGVSNFEGKPSAIPAFALTYEEGKWIERLLNSSQRVALRMTVKSLCKELTTGNLVVSFPGKVKSKIVVGAHVDSWDVGQGAVDNGIGTAILFDLARLLKKYSPENYYSVDLVWFNGEELGLWGAKKYVSMHQKDDIFAMVNMDMTGSPTGFNAMGTDSAISFLKDLSEKLNGFDLKAGVANVPYTNSDHEPFMLAGIPTLSTQAHLDEEMYKYYHETGDTFDKVSKKYLSDAAAVMSVFVSELANNTTLKLQHRSDKETIEMLKKYKVDERLKRQKEWPFKEQ